MKTLAVGALFCFSIASTSLTVQGQVNNKNLERLYEQASEVSSLVIEYSNDVRAIQYVYGPMANAFRGKVNYSPEQFERLRRLNSDYLDRLKKEEFDSFSIHGQVDYVLLKQKIERFQNELDLMEKMYNTLKGYLTFSKPIHDFEIQRRRAEYVEGEVLATNLHQSKLDLLKVKSQISALKEMDEEQSEYLQGYILDLRERLRNSFNFYNGYDPMFNWWVPEPYKDLDEELVKLAELVKSKSNAKVANDGSNIGGKAVGRAEFTRLLQDEMIPYTPEELLKIADQEFAWCVNELLKASREMGFGDDWKAAQEKVKNSYVEPGKQPQLIIKLLDDALEFINARDLVTMPPISEEGWGMQMMSPEQQQVSPFFLGGRNILIAYPTNTMSHEQKLMSMRGNNPYFSRGIVQHELIPGHHLQHYMSPRYKSYRGEAFRTPFWTEGWTLYWELLLWDLGFPKTPEERIGMLFWRMHRAARITFSIKYHLGEWTPQQCIDYLVDRVGHEPSTAHGEVKRSFEGNYGPLYQLAYLTGGLQVWSLKKELVDSGKMGYKEFHDRFMKENHMPIELLRATLKNEKLSRDFKSTWKFYDFK